MTNVCFTGKDDFLDSTRAACERAAMDVLDWQPVQRVARNAVGSGNILVHRAHPNLTGKLKAAQANGWHLLTYQEFYGRVVQENENRTAIDAAFPQSRANIRAPVRDGGRMVMQPDELHTHMVERAGGPSIADIQRAQRRDSAQRTQRRRDKTEDVFDDTTRDLDI